MKIVAYGSLMNEVSLKKTMGREMRLTKIAIPGYKRVFNAPFGNYAFLNIMTCMTSVLEAAYFELEASELIKFETREAGSKLQEIQNGYYAFVWPQEKTKYGAVLQSYINVCIEGAQKLSINFWSSTQKPKKIIDDTCAPVYTL